MEISVKENSRIDTIDIAYSDAIKALDINSGYISNSLLSCKINKVSVDMNVALITHYDENLNIPLLSKVMVNIFGDFPEVLEVTRNLDDGKYSCAVCDIDVGSNIDARVMAFKRFDSSGVCVSNGRVGLWIDHNRQVAYLVSYYDQRWRLNMKHRNSSTMWRAVRNDLLTWMGMTKINISDDSAPEVVWDTHGHEFINSRMDLWAMSHGEIETELNKAYIEGFLVPQMLHILMHKHTRESLRGIGHFRFMDVPAIHFMTNSDLDEVKELIRNTDWGNIQSDLEYMLTKLIPSIPILKRLDEIVRCKLFGNFSGLTSIYARVDLSKIFYTSPEQNVIVSEWLETVMSISNE